VPTASAVAAPFRVKLLVFQWVALGHGAKCQWVLIPGPGLTARDCDLRLPVPGIEPGSLDAAAAPGAIVQTAGAAPADSEPAPHCCQCPAAGAPRV
jgi:hypothetical protein